MKTTQILLLLSALGFIGSAQADQLFVIRKNLNPKNELYYKATVDNCQFVQPFIKPYWYMGEKDGQLEGLTQAEKPFFTPRISYASSKIIEFSFGAMDKLGNQLPDNNIRVELEDCKAVAFIEVSNQEVELKEIKVKMGLTFNIKTMSLIGIGPDGNKVTQDFSN
jgi:hypothetical protein